MTDTDRLQRAGHYVSGLMSEPERERAERDLERDSSFREAVMTVSHRMRVIDGKPSLNAAADDHWAEISSRLAGLPHLNGVLIKQDNEPAFRVAQVKRKPAVRQMLTRHREGVRLGALATCLAAVFVAGYFAGTHSTVSAPTLAQVDLNSAN